MAFTVMTDVPNPLFDQNGDPFSGAVLKAYEPGTTTPISIYIDDAGSSPQASITYNAEGKLEVSGNEILPYIDRKHKWGVFANATDAAADTPFYMGPFDDVKQVAAPEASAIIYNEGSAGAVDRTIDEKFQESISVKDFGATGDASTDDSAAFLAAWAAAKRLADIDDSYNGAVYIPQGDYYLASGVVFDDTNASGKIRVYGDVQNDVNIIVGVDQVGLDFDCGTPICEYLTVWSKPTWDATVAASGSLTIVKDTSGIGIRSLLGGRPRFKNLTAYGFGGSGIYSTRMTKGLIEWNRVTGCGTGINVPTPGTTTTTSHIANNYVSSCDLGYNLNKVTHSTFYNNIAEAGVKGLDASLCTNTIFERMYFESNSDMHYEILNSRCIINDVSEVDGSGGPPANASLFYYNASVSLSDIFKQEVNSDGIASSHFGLLSYDDGGSSTKGFVKNEFLPTQTRQVRGIRINNRETKSGAINAIGTFPLVNGAKAAHISTLHIKADGTVITDDDMFQGNVTKVAAGEYELDHVTQTYPDWVHVTPYVSYTTGATTPRFATVSYNNGAGLNDFTDYDGGNIISRIYVVIFDAAGNEVDCGFTITIGWNMNDDLLS